MNSLKLLVAFSFTLLLTQLALSQCCCSGAEVTITNGAEFALPAQDVSVSALNGSRGDIRNVSREDPSDEARFRFYVGCGTGKETIVVEYMGVQMRVRFKLYGDFGRPAAKIVFAQGDYVAEFEKEREDEGAQKVVLREATAEEMKEVEPPERSDAPVDQTANPT